MHLNANNYTQQLNRNVNFLCDLYKRLPLRLLSFFSLKDSLVISSLGFVINSLIRFLKKDNQLIRLNDISKFLLPASTQISFHLAINLKEIPSSYQELFVKKNIFLDMQ